MTTHTSDYPDGFSVFSAMTAVLKRRSDTAFVVPGRASAYP